MWKIMGSVDEETEKWFTGTQISLQNKTFTEHLPVVVAGAVVRGSQLSLGFRAQILFLTSSTLQVLF